MIYHILPFCSSLVNKFPNSLHSVRENSLFVNCVFFNLQTHVNISIDTKHQTMQGVAFPIDSVAYEKLEQLREGQLNYVQLVSRNSSKAMSNFTMAKSEHYLSEVAW